MAKMTPEKLLDMSVFDHASLDDLLKVAEAAHQWKEDQERMERLGLAIANLANMDVNGLLCFCTEEDIDWLTTLVAGDGREGDTSA